MMSDFWASTRVLTRIVVALTLVGSLLVLPASVAAEHAGAAAEQAAREIQDARDRANAAAQAMFDAESEIDTLDLEIADTERRVGELEAQVGAMRATLEGRAVQRFTQGATSGNPLLTPIAEMNAVAAADVYANAATGSALASVDSYESAITDLDHLRADLDRQREDAANARQDYIALKANAEAEVVNLQAIEQERIADANVQHELERLRREREEQERREQEAAAAAAAAAAATSGTGSGSSGAGSGGSSGSESGSGAGGDGGGGASPPTPEPPPPPPPGMVCPVAGPNAFADTWGAPRSGGRKHQGVDMMAPGGTPLVAADSGAALFKTNALGGNAVWLTADNGTKYYYAHLSAWEGSSRSVSKGEVIGYVGATGNTSVNHLHFEVHPGGGAAVNPYPYVRAVC